MKQSTKYIIATALLASGVMWGPPSKGTLSCGLFDCFKGTTGAERETAEQESPNPDNPGKDIGTVPTVAQASTAPDVQVETELETLKREVASNAVAKEDGFDIRITIGSEVVYNILKNKQDQSKGWDNQNFKNACESLLGALMNWSKPTKTYIRHSPRYVTKDKSLTINEEVEYRDRAKDISIIVDLTEPNVIVIMRRDAYNNDAQLQKIAPFSPEEIARKKREEE